MVAKRLGGLLGTRKQAVRNAYEPLARSAGMRLT